MTLVSLHPLAGAVLPVWKELTDVVLGKEAAKSRGKPRVLRAVLEGGRKITGAWVRVRVGVGI